MNLRYVGHILMVLLFVRFSWATPQVTTYQARIIKPDGYPLEAASVNFKFTILSPAGNCILYSETYSSVSMLGTGGLMSFPLGSGIRVYPASGTTFADVFDNSVASLTCDTGGPADYQPDASDIRKIVMQFNDGNGWQTLPAMNINAVPYAIYANDAMKLGGVSATSYVQYSTLPTCTASESLSYNGTSFSCVVAGGAPTNVTSSTVITALGYTPADGASVTAVSSYAAAVSSAVYSVSSTVSTLQSTLAASFASLVSSQWNTSGTTITYVAGRVGIGTASPQTSLDVAGELLVSDSPASYFVKTNAGEVFSAATWGGALVGGRIGNPTAANQKLGETVFAVGNLSGYSAGAGIKAFSTQAWNLGSQQGTRLDFFTIPNNTATTTTRMTIDQSGYVGIGKVIPVTTLDVSGGVRISMESATCAVSYAGTLRYNSGNVEFCNGSAWTAFGLSTSGLTSFNGSVSQTQTLANGTSGNAPAFVTVNGVHTLNIPLASAGSVTAGLISNADYVNFNNKITSSAASIAQVLGYTPANSATTISSQWITSGTAIGYVSGSVGVGTATPQGKFNIAGGDFYVGTGTQINGSASEDIFAEGNLEVHGPQGLTIGSTAGGFLVTNTNSNRRSLTLTGSGTASSESAGHLILGNNRATASASDLLGLIEFGTSGNGGGGANRSAAKIETKLSGAGGANGFGAYTAFSTKPDNVAALVEAMRITAEGNIGIGTTTPGTNTKLNVAGQIKTGSASITTGAVDWNVGNAVLTSFDCSSNITFANLRDGGNYTLVVTSTGTTQCNFSATLTGDDAGTVSYRFKPANTVRDGSSHTIYSLMRIGNIVYVSWISGF